MVTDRILDSRGEALRTTVLLLFVDDVVLLVSPSHDLQEAPELFTVEREAVETRVSSCESEVKVLD